MKDALGHGSNKRGAHAAGIEQLGAAQLPPARVPLTQEALERLDIDTLDKSAFGYKSGDIVSVNPAQLRLQYPGDMENPEAKFKQGGMRWVRSVDLREPIDVDIKSDGRMYLADGHHRYFAAKMLGQPLRAKIDIKAKPIPVILKRGRL